MPIPGYSPVPPPEYITGAEAVEMVMARFKWSACTEAEAYALLTERLDQRTLKLLWEGINAEHPYGPGLYLKGEDFIYIPGFPGARAIDELDWKAATLTRRLRTLKPVKRKGADADPLRLLFVMETADEMRQRVMSRYGFGATDSSDEPEPEEWSTEELIYRFRVKHASLVEILDVVGVSPDAVRIPLAEAVRFIADTLHRSARNAFETLDNAITTKRIRQWQMVRSESGRVSWSELYFFRADLEQLARELADDSTAPNTEPEGDEDRAEAEIGTYLPNRGRAGRAAAGFWEEAEDEAMRWLEENGFPAPNDGNQATLERHILDWLAERKHEASEATARRHVRRCIARYRDQIGAEDQNAMK